MVSDPDRRRGRRGEPTPTPVKAAALERGLRSPMSPTTCWRSGRPRCGGGLRPPHQAARGSRSSPWSTCTSPCCPAGGARRRWSGPCWPATTYRGVRHGGGGGPRHRWGVRPGRGADRTPPPPPRRCGPSWSRRAAACWSTAVRRPRRTGAPGRRRGHLRREADRGDWSSTGRRPAAAVAGRAGRRGVDDVPGRAAQGAGGGARARRGPDRRRRSLQPTRHGAQPGRAVGPGAGRGAVRLVEVQPEGKGADAVRRVGERRTAGAGRAARP